MQQFITVHFADSLPKQIRYNGKLWSMSTQQLKKFQANEICILPFHASLFVLLSRLASVYVTASAAQCCCFFQRRFTCYAPVSWKRRPKIEVLQGEQQTGGAQCNLSSHYSWTEGPSEILEPRSGHSSRHSRTSAQAFSDGITRSRFRGSYSPLVPQVQGPNVLLSAYKQSPKALASLLKLATDCLKSKWGQQLHRRLAIR